MARDLSSFSGAETDLAQTRFYCVLVGLDAGARLLTSLDVSVFLNLSTGAGALIPGVGLSEFIPAQMVVPQLGETDASLLDSVSVELSNLTSTWWSVLAANDFRDAPVTIWEGRISLTPGAPTGGATVLGAVVLWSGFLETISATPATATLTVSRRGGTRLFTMPRYSYGPPDFLRCPEPGSELVWGYTTREV